MEHPKPLAPLKSSRFKIEIFRWPLLEIARQITLIDFNLFSKIEPKECLNQSWNKKEQKTKAPNIYAMIQRFNALSGWIATCIVTQEDLEKRIAMLQNAIEIAKVPPAHFSGSLSNFKFGGKKSLF